MGKSIQNLEGVSDAGAGAGCGRRLVCPFPSITLRCVLVLILSVCVLLSALFWLPPFRSSRSSFHPSDDALAADIQATFMLAKPFAQLVPHVQKLEYDIFEEIGVPESKVSVISLHPSTPTNVTAVVFGVLPYSKYVSISSPFLSLLKSSFVELALQQVNLSLSPALFGHSSAFEVLKFPGGISITPGQPVSLWKMPQILFNFTLNNSISQISKNFDQLKIQLKFGLQLRYYENVYLELTNTKGSTVRSPVTVQASVLSDIGSHILLPDRLKELAAIIIGPDAKNLGLDHAVFGKVKCVQLSSYLKDSISSIGSPSPSPSPSPSSSPSPSPSPASSPSPSPSPSEAPASSPAPCLIPICCNPSTSPYPATPELGPSPQSSSSDTTPRKGSHIHPSLPPKASPRHHVDPPASGNSPSPSVPLKPGTWGSTPKMSPSLTPFPSPSRHGSQPRSVEGNREASIAPASVFLEVSRSLPSCKAHGYIWHMLLLGFVAFHLIHRR
ncbi:hypothetical protein IHE45_18G022900 [Dioscorea alata]|uniref:Uncharacterized protein n=1 Tax=Dioscorea alata TaxID=55571 RepID=A0ACB7U5T2_DIOAL|nr:hypothetical protein IHE45_18G022900 [Dioscorea alata]